MIKNKFNIICCSYNNEEWAETHLESILEQTYDNYEVIYVNDASTDKTMDIVNKKVGKDKRFHIINNKVNLDSPTNYFKYSYEFMKNKDDNEILVELCGDDWFATPTVLEQLNEVYNKKDCWLTYGGMRVWNGGDDITLPNPQNSDYHSFIHENSLYRQDKWRAGHLHSFRWFLHKQFNWEKDAISRFDNEIFKHAVDLQLQFSVMEMCPPEKITNLDFPTVVFNNAPKRERPLKDGTYRDSQENVKYEVEVRNKKRYKRVNSKDELKGEKLPQINVIGYFQETNYIPKDFSFVYNLEEGDFDMTIITDMDLLPYLKNEKKFPKGKIVADLHESPLYNKIQKEVYDLVYQNYNKFELILTYDAKLLTLPNSQRRLCLWRCLNKNIHTKEWPLLADDSLCKIYPKSKNISCISSNKAFLPGHKKRLDFVNHIIDSKGLDMFGIGFNPIPGKIDGLKDYRFSVAIENTYEENNCTEKISDCFLTGTIPVYYGCPNIGDIFDINGIITFTSKEELDTIVKDIILNGEKIYQDKLSAVKNNFKLANKYSMNSDQIFNNHLKKLI